jgi:hypothetical protein
VKLADAFPPDTVPEVTGKPTCVAPLNTVNVTVPEPSVPDGLVTVADRVTLWLLALKFAETLAAVVVVPAAFTVRVCELSELVRKLPAPP